MPAGAGGAAGEPAPPGAAGPAAAADGIAAPGAAGRDVESAPPAAAPASSGIPAPGGQGTAAPVPASPARSAGLADEIRALVEGGTPDGLREALERLRSRSLESGEFGRAMTAVIVSLMHKLYPGIRMDLPLADPPQTHIYTRILREAGRGNYVSPPAASRDFLELVLPSLALFQDAPSGAVSGAAASTRSGTAAARADLARAREINPHSVLPPFFLAWLEEREGRDDAALAFYEETLAVSDGCYPAALGKARILENRGRRQEAIGLLQALAVRWPDNQGIRRQLAAAWYHARDWSRAEPAIAQVLRDDPRDSPMILARAHALVEQGKYLQAQAPLDTYGSIDPYSRLYLLLRARVQENGYRNRDAALNYLRSILRSNPADTEAAVYAARLLLESGRREDQAEGRALLARLLEMENPPPEVTALAVQEAIQREAWREAQTLLAPLLQGRRSSQDLLNAWTVERNLGNNAAALQAARELYQRESGNDDGILAYAASLIDTGRQAEARRIIEGRIGAVPGGSLKARYYHLRSRLAADDDQIIADLRTSLFEDPRNLDALIGMVEVYHRRGDGRRALYYLRLALAIAPENPRLRRWESRYAGQL